MQKLIIHIKTISLIIFLSASLSGYAQPGNNNIVIDSKLIKKLLDICVEKADQINLTCAPPRYKNYIYAYVVKIKRDVGCNDSIKIIIGEAWNKKDLLPVERIYGIIPGRVDQFLSLRMAF